MDLNKPKSSLSSDEKQVATDRLNRAKPYGTKRKVWVEDGHVFVDGHDGVTISMDPEVAIAMGRLLNEAGTDALINRVMDEPGKSQES